MTDGFGNLRLMLSVSRARYPLHIIVMGPLIERIADCEALLESHPLSAELVLWG